MSGVFSELMPGFPQIVFSGIRRRVHDSTTVYLRGKKMLLKLELHFIDVYDYNDYVVRGH